MDWLLGLQNLVRGAQTDPTAFASKAAGAGIDPGQIELLLQQQLGIMQAPQAPGQTTGAVPQSVDAIINGPSDLKTYGFSTAAQTGSQPPKDTTLPPVGPTAERLPGERASPLLDIDAMKGTKPTWEVMNPAAINPKAFETSKTPGLTPEQLAKIASMIPKATTPPAVPSGGGGHAPRTVQMTQLGVAQGKPRVSLADLLKGGR